jgi:hypothetical protein
MRQAKTLRNVAVAGGLATFALSEMGCAGTTTVAATTSYPATTPLVYDCPVTYVAAVPDFQYYPRTYYRGSYAYLVNGRWYYQNRGQWVVFREEPRELYRYRVYDYDRLEAPRRVRGAEYGTVPQEHRLQPAPPPLSTAPAPRHDERY